MSEADKDIERIVEEAGPRRYEDLYAKRLFLVVDSLPQMQRALGMALESFGASKIDYAAKPADALGKMAKVAYDVVLCDYDLGNGCDGLYLFEEARERNLIKQSCVCMIVTGERRGARVMSAAEMAPDGYLLKPFTGEVLRSRLEKAMRKREAFRLVDEAMRHHEYLTAMERCARRIAEGGEFHADFIKLKGQLALKIGDYEAARVLYLDALRQRPSTWAKLGLAKSLASLQDFGQARMLFEQVLEDNDQVMEAYDWLARLYRENNELARAQEILQNAAERSPVMFRRQQQLAEVALLNHDLAAAEAACQETVELARHTWRRSPALNAQLARVQLARGDTTTVVRTLAAMRRDFRSDDVGEWLADIIDCQLQSRNGHPDKARELLAAVESRFGGLSSRLTADAQLEYARACYGQGDGASGDAAMRALVRNHHDDEALLSRCGALFEELGRGEAGRRLISENVQSLLELNNQGVRDAQEGRFDAALAHFARAHEEMPQNVQVMLNLVNATLAYVYRQGWHESHMHRAYDLLCHVRDTAPNNNKFQKILQAWRALVEKMGKPQWVL